MALIQNNMRTTSEVKEELRGAIVRFNELGLGHAKRTLILDENSRSAFWVKGGGELREISPFFSKLLTAKMRVLEKRGGIAFVGARRIFSSIRIYEDEDVLEPGGGFEDCTGHTRAFFKLDSPLERTAIHELAHCSEKARRCFRKIILSRHFELCDYHPLLGRENISKRERLFLLLYMNKTLEEGFADFVATCAVDPKILESNEHADWLARTSGEYTYIKHLLKERRGVRKLWQDMKRRSPEYHIGENFFFQAHFMLKAAPSDYLDLLVSMPPTPEELLHPYGGRKWAKELKDAN